MSDADRDGKRAGTGGDGFVSDDGTQPLRRPIVQAGIRQQDGELLTAISSDQVTLTDHSRESLPHGANHVVPRGMTVGVVHQLEVIDVDHQHCQRAVAACCAGDVAVGGFEEVTSVGKVRSARRSRPMTGLARAGLLSHEPSCPGAPVYWRSPTRFSAPGWVMSS
jgi:hypothetical protein